MYGADAAHEDGELAVIQRILSRRDDPRERARPPGREALGRDVHRQGRGPRARQRGGVDVGCVWAARTGCSHRRWVSGGDLRRLGEFEDDVESSEQLARVDEGEFAEAREEWEQRGGGGGSGRKEEANGRHAARTEIRLAGIIGGGIE
ncbi:hypothetical protein B0H17DRAFT_1135507 [Mycena rosella]|uniref:Uncharacterized protein n=1 Tax=Mycena rosella TaxID=1033263 RepID=A0AAD7DDM2_MYCRO|nr:hypothetical protein B0H17DRAFT_1135507 [Mycena rosella]